MNTQLAVHSSDFIQQQGRFWMPAQTLGEKIGFKNPRKTMSVVYSRNEDELEPFQGVIKMMTPGGEQSVRAFDEQGCYIVAMLAKTPQAKTFRQRLAKFLQKLRGSRSRVMEMRFKIAELQEQYDEMRTKKAHFELQQTIDRTEWTWETLERMHELTGVLSWEELARLYNSSPRYMRRMNKRYRHSQGDHQDRRPKSLRGAQ